MIRPRPSNIQARAEFERTLELLREFTSKLKDICDLQLKVNQTRQKYIILCGFAIVLSVGILLFLSLQRDVSDFMGHISPYVFSIAATITLELALFLFMPRLRAKASDHTRAVHWSVRHLLQYASQYYDNTTKGYRKKLEVEIRLNEAESVLAIYRQLFIP